MLKRRLALSSQFREFVTGSFQKERRIAEVEQMFAHYLGTGLAPQDQQFGYAPQVEQYGYAR